MKQLLLLLAVFLSMQAFGLKKARTTIPHDSAHLSVDTVFDGMFKERVREMSRMNHLNLLSEKAAATRKGGFWRGAWIGAAIGGGSGAIAGLSIKPTAWFTRGDQAWILGITGALSGAILGGIIGLLSRQKD